MPVNEDLARDLTAGNTSAIAHAEKKMAEVTPSNGGGGQSVQKKVADFRKKANAVVKQYDDGKIEYQEAFTKLEDLFTKTADTMEDGEAKQEVLLAFAEAVQDLNTIQQERETQPAKPDYSAMSLDELKAERQKWLDEEVDRWNKNPGGQGTDNGYTHNDRGEINGRYGGSNNPDWYQWAYKRNGNQKPAKRDYPMFADEYLRNTQEYDELVQEIERREAAETKKAAKTGGQESSQTVSNNNDNETVNGGEVVVTGDEFGEYKDIKELRKKAVKYYSDNLQGTSVENATLGKIDIDENGLVNFTGAGKREMKSTSAKAHKLLLVKYLPNLIKGATDITSNEAVKERHANETFYYLHTEAVINGKKTPVDITLVKRNDGSIQYYNHVLPSEETKDTSVSPGPESSNEALGTPAVDVSLVTSSVPQEQKNVEKENSEKEDSQVAATEDVNPFGDLDEAFADFAKQAGFEPVKQEKPKAKSKSKAKKKRNMGVKDASKEREEELIKQLKSALNKAHALPMFDPDVVVPAFQLARIYVQRGANSFAEYARDMIDAVGDKVRGWLHPVWEMVENYPDGKEIDESLVLLSCTLTRRLRLMMYGLILRSGQERTRRSGLTIC